MKHLCYILLVSVALLGCRKDKPAKPVEIYLLKSFQLVSGKCQVDAASVVLEDQPIVANSDILKYKQAEYEYSLTDVAYNKIKSLTPRTPFAFTVDGEIIFYCIYMPSFMSSTCGQSITMDINLENKVALRLGYPWAMGSVAIDDQRNNSAIITSLRNQRKLK